MIFKQTKFAGAGRTLTTMCAALALVAFGAADRVEAAVIYDTSVDHSSEVATAAGVLAGSLGTGTGTFSGSTAAGWSGMVAGLGSGDVLLLGQASSTDNADSAAVKSFVEGGGRVIQLWGENGGFPADLNLGSAITGNAFTNVFAGSTSLGTTIAKTGAAAGTSFASTVATLTGASDHGGIMTGSLGSAISMYEVGGNSHVAVDAVGAGHWAFVSWDWCCVASPAVRSEWDDVLFAAATYTSPVPLPAGMPLLLGGIAAFGFMRRRRAA